MRNSGDIGNLWPHMVAYYGSTVDVFSGSCCSKSLEVFYDVGFVFHPSAIASSNSLIHLRVFTPFFSRLGAMFFDFKRIQVAKSDFKWQHLMACLLTIFFFFLVYHLRSFLYKAT